MLPWASLVAHVVKNLPVMEEARLHPWVRKIPWRRERQLTSAFLPGEFHGQRSLAGYSPRGLKESDTTERLHLIFIYIENFVQNHYTSVQCLKAVALELKTVLPHFALVCFIFF